MELNFGREFGIAADALEALLDQELKLIILKYQLYLEALKFSR